MPRNDYRERLEARRDRYANRAVKAATEAKQRSDKAWNVIHAMNGTPILIGHHSEKRHRAAIDKIDRDLGKSVELDRKARHYQGKAASAGTAGISSDDPQALELLAEKLAGMEAKREKMKRINAGFKSAKKLATLSPEEQNEVAVWRTKLPDPRCPYIKTPFEGYMLTNLGGNIRRVRERIETLKREAARAVRVQQNGRTETELFTFEGGRAVENFEVNRVLIYFENIPSRDTRTTLKGYGFRWARGMGAWSALLNERSRCAARLALA